MQGEAVVLRGKATGEYRYDGAVANRALELLGKELGLFTERGEPSRVRYLVSDTPLPKEQWEARYASGSE